MAARSGDSSYCLSSDACEDGAVLYKWRQECVAAGIADYDVSTLENLAGIPGCIDKTEGLSRIELSLLLAFPAFATSKPGRGQISLVLPSPGF